jgi:tetratricopeptide (TPR) repeat protein
MDKAIAESSKAIELDPKCAPAWYTRGFALRHQGKVDLAIAAYERAIEVDPKFDMPHNSLAWLLATRPEAKLRDPNRAVELAKKALALDPKTEIGSYWNTLGVAHYRAGNWKDAVTALDKSMELRQGGNSNDWFFLAMAHWQLCNKEEARKRYDQAVQWMDKHQPKDEQLRRFRTEAAELLGVKEKKM